MSDAFDVPIEIADVTIVGPLPLPVTGTITTDPDVNIHASNGGTLTATGTSLNANVTNFPATQAVTQSTTPWIVDGSGVVQPVSGPLTDAELRASPVPVTIPTPVPVTDNGGSLTVDGTVGVTQVTSPWVISGTVTATPTGTQDVNIVGTTVTQPISAVSLPLPTGAATEATLVTRLADATFTGRINTLGQKTMAASTPVVIASDQSTLPVSFASSAGTATVIRVATSTTVATALVANANRTGLIINTEGGTTYVKFGSTATTTDYTVELAGNSYYDYQGYKGIVTVIRASGTGNIQVTEVS